MFHSGLSAQEKPQYQKVEQKELIKTIILKDAVTITTILKAQIYYVEYVDSVRYQKTH